MRPLEFNGMIGRTNDYSGMKQSEDSKPVVEQQNLTVIHEKQTEVQAHQVNEQENASKEQFDAKNGGKGSFQEQQEKKRKKKIEEEGIVEIKHPNTHFDFKV